MDNANYLTAKLVWNRDLTVLPVADLNAALLEKLGGQREDFIVSLKNARVHSKRISRDAKLFLDRFRQPLLFLPAVIDHAETYGLDPDELLTQVFPLVQSLLRHDFLAEEGREAPHTRKPLFEKDDRFGAYTIVACIRFLHDTELYKAVDETGRPVLIKCIANADDVLRHNFSNEAAILALLNAESTDHVPQLIEARPGPDYNFLVIEWFDGQSLWELLHSGQPTFADKATLVSAIARAYAYLHRRGILHADVHMNNILVGRDLRVKLIDFGSAIRIGVTGPFDLRARAGVTGCYEPEFAAALLENRRVCATESGEQYQLAVLLYQLVVGAPYLALSYETTTALEEIVTLPPRPFAEFNLAAPRLERVLRRALAKAPGQRYRQIPTFHRRVQAAAEELRTIPDPASAIPSTPRHDAAIFEDFIADFIRRYGLDSEKFTAPLQQRPYSSLFHGAAGIAYTFLRLAYLRNDGELLALADAWRVKAAGAERKNGAFEHPEIGMPLHAVGPDSLFHQWPGPRLLDALLEYAMNNEAGCLAAATRLLDRLDIASIETVPFPPQARRRDRGDLPAHRLDPTQGPGSLLPALSALRSIGKNLDDFPMRRLDALFQRIAAGLTPAIHRALTAPLAADNPYFGFAHGACGLLHAILQTGIAFEDEHAAQVRAALDRMAALGCKQGDATCWPVGRHDSAVWHGWCHGTAGHILLWLAAYDRWPEDRYLELAVRAGNHLWQHGRDCGPSLCCGLAGQSLSLYQLGKATREARWLERGRALARRALQAVPDFVLPDSLFQGYVGLAWVAGESVAAEEAVWPVLQRWM